LDELRKVLYATAAEIGRLLRGDVEDARLALAKYVDQLTLTPRNTPEGPLLDIAGEVELFNGFEEGDGVCISNGGQRRDRTALVMESVTYRFEKVQKAPKVPECPNGLANLLQNLSCVGEIGEGNGCVGWLCLPMIAYREMG
jgi:hypothetical protein